MLYACMPYGCLCVCVCVCVLALPFLTSSIFFHFYFPFSLSYYASSLSFPSVVPYPFFPPPFLPSLLTFPHTPYSTLQLTVMKTRGKPEVSAQSSAEQVHRTIHCLYKYCMSLSCTNCQYLLSFLYSSFLSLGYILLSFFLSLHITLFLSYLFFFHFFL